jgi:hypothetical protein
MSYIEVLGRSHPYTVYKTDYGLYFEHDELGEDDSCCVWLEGKKVTDYDSCYVMPDEVGAWLARWDYSNVVFNFEHKHWDLEE